MTATTATFPITANHVTADTPVIVIGSLAGTTRSGMVTIKAQPAIVVVQKAAYLVKKGQLIVQATSTDIEPVGSDIAPSLTVQDFAGGLAVAAVAHR